MMHTPTNPSGIVDPEAARTAPSAQGDGPAQAQPVETAGTRPSGSMTDFSCVYFGYGSNLSPRTMKQRCPDSLYIGMAELKDWKWIINETGYANIIRSPGDVVYGSLCFLSRRDEMALDESEGVPWLYEKMELPVTRLVGDSDQSSDWTQGGSSLQVTAMTYVDVQRIAVGKIEREYVVWVRKAIEDGRLAGMPASYAEKYMAPFMASEGEGAKLQDIVMIRTTRFGEHSAGIVPRGFASWNRG